MRPNWVIENILSSASYFFKDPSLLGFMLLRDPIKHTETKNLLDH